MLETRRQKYFYNFRFYNWFSPNVKECRVEGEGKGRLSFTAHYDLSSGTDQESSLIAPKSHKMRGKGTQHNTATVV
ncbi:hypothetical protein RJZ57_007330 [Blastomyces gilchristii]